MQNLHDNPYRTTFKLVLKTFVLLLVISGLVAWDLPFASQRARGDNRYRDGKYEEAITHYNRAVEKDPANWELNYNLGTSYYRIGDWEKAVQTLTLAKNLAEKWGAPKSEIGKIYHNLGLSYLQLGDCENAIPALGNAVELEKNDEDMQRNYRFAMEYCEEEGKSGDESEDQNQDGEGESEDEQDQNGDGESEDESESESDEQSDENGGESEDEQENGDENSQNGESEDESDGEQQDNQDQNDGKSENEQNGGQESRDNVSQQPRPSEIPKDGLNLTDEQIRQILRSIQEREQRNAPRYFKNTPDDGYYMDPESLVDLFRRWFLGLPPSSDLEMPDDGIDW